MGKERVLRIGEASSMGFRHGSSEGSQLIIASRFSECAGRLATPHEHP